jgi:outer membrane protein assembly factor BamD (BamD/ComL family)
MSKRHTSKIITFLFGAACIVTPVAATVLACGWPGTDHSVRFNDYRSEKEFGRLPPLPRYTDDEERKSRLPEDQYDYERAEKDRKQIEALWSEALSADERGDFLTERKALLDYLERTKSLGFRWNGGQDVQRLRNSAIDMLDAITALDQGSPAEAVQAYLDARSAYDFNGTIGVLTHLNGARSDKNLADNALYLEAAVQYHHGEKEAANKFNLLAAKYPHSEKREAALYMSGVASMKQSKSFDNAKKQGATAPVCDECRDQSWQAARRAFERVISEYPRGRYTTEARGWLAYLSLGVGDRAGALIEYYRMLTTKDDENARIEAVRSLRLARRHASSVEMSRVEAVLEAEPAAALAYAYHCIYNYALVPDWSWHDYGEFKEDRSELERITAFASRLLRRYSGMAVSGGFSLRVAQANLELDRNQEAARFARLAQAAGVEGDERAEALFVEGIAEYRLRHFKAARGALSKLIAESRNSELTTCARRSLAMVAEDMGDLDGALEQYLALDYNLDVGYFLDVLMTPDQIARFIEAHPAISQRDEVYYALGVRYLRDRRWTEARQTLSRVRTTGRGVDDDYNYRYRYSYGEQEHTSAKDNSWNPAIKGIRPHWVEQDLRTANDLERLEKEVEAAEGDEAKAEALYQLASYQYQGTLLFYNPAAWNGDRHYRLNDLDGQGKFRQPNEAQLLFNNMQSHDRAARALPIYLEVVRRYPNTRAARDALYTAAVCHERLSEYNNYWRGIYSTGGHAGERLVTYKDVRATYPAYRLPLGTMGWEPATRTVNGGPGWAAPPKPKPRPSRRQRLFQAANLWVFQLTKSWEALRDWLANLLYCFWVGFGFSTLLFLWIDTMRARMILRLELARCKARTPEEIKQVRPAIEGRWTRSKIDQYLNCESRDELKEAVGNGVYKLRQLWVDKRGFAALAWNAASHGLLVILLILWLQAL